MAPSLPRMTEETRPSRFGCSCGRGDGKAGHTITEHFESAAARIGGRDPHIGPVTPRKIAYNPPRAAETATLAHGGNAARRAVGPEQRNVDVECIAGQLAQRLSAG